MGVPSSRAARRTVKASESAQSRPTSCLATGKASVPGSVTDDVAYVFVKAAQPSSPGSGRSPGTTPMQVF